MYKTVSADLDWTTKTEWLWPAVDEKMLGAFYMSPEIDQVVKHVPGRDVVVQAGGDAGVWPLRLSQLFGDVYTFEPQPQNWHCLRENCRGVANIFAYPFALSDKHQKVEVSVPIESNLGAGHIVPSDGGSEAMLIDDLALDVCDLIYLDIEGAELDALKGAAATIDRCRPVICFEDKPLPWMGVFNREVGDPGRWLAERGYKCITKVHWDYIWAPC